MNIFLCDIEGKVCLVGFYPREYARIQAVFESWEMAKKVFPLARTATLVEGSLKCL